MLDPQDLYRGSFGDMSAISGPIQGPFCSFLALGLGYFVPKKQIPLDSVELKGRLQTNAMTVGPFFVSNTLRLFATKDGTDETLCYISIYTSIQIIKQGYRLVL